MFHRVGGSIGLGMTILQPLGNDKHPSSCMDRSVGNTGFPSRHSRCLDFTAVDSSPTWIIILLLLLRVWMDVKYLNNNLTVALFLLPPA